MVETTFRGDTLQLSLAIQQEFVLLLAGKVGFTRVSWCAVENQGHD
jgi:hypothetical protein